MLTLGLDIGGANLKAATSTGEGRSEAFAVWHAPHELAGRLRELISRFPRPDLIAVTMTAELADCFSTKAEGVAAIAGAVRQAAGGTPCAFWQTSGEFSEREGECSCRMVAAANWHALATWAGRLAPHGTGLLCDVGSTTTDLIPLRDGRPAARGATDVERLVCGELLYSGARRTPLCAVCSTVTVRGRVCPVAAELFATTLDVFLLLGMIPEDDSDRQTGDGRPASLRCAHDRIARMVCCDREEIDLAEARSIARCFFESQFGQLCRALESAAGRTDAPVQTVIVSGSGEFLGRMLVADHPRTKSAKIIRLASSLSPALADAACAYALAVLALERT